MSFNERRRNKFNVCLINARSIISKLSSLLETLTEIDVDICMLTETWLKNDPNIERNVEDFENQHGYAFIRRDRMAGRRGGGVAICYNKEQITMSRIRLPPTKYELVGAIGRRVGQRRKVAALAVYLPPALNAEQVRRCLSDVNDAIIHIKNKYCDPYIIIGGDFNRTDIGRALADHADIKQIRTAPTRGTNVLDIIATNFNELLIDSGVTEPIESEDGVPTDHLTVFSTFKMSRVPEYRVEEYSYYHINQEGKNKFGKWLSGNDWRGVMTAGDVDAKVDKLHESFEKGISESFEYRTRKKKSSEPVWMTDGIRDMIRMRRKLFKKMKRRGSWQSLKERVSSIVDERKRVNDERILESFLSNKDPRNFHRAIKKLLGENAPPQWRPQQLYPDASHKEAAENIAEYFNSISQEYEPLNQRDVPTTYSRPIELLTTDQVAKRLKESKKTNSTVPGDLFPSLYQSHYEALAVPITDIYNTILRNKTWPNKWKTEYVTIIPKLPTPEIPSECRNISCTNFLSKVFERIVLDLAREEVTPKLNQFGGEPKASTTHLLMSDEKEWSTPRTVNAGAPQGSVLGCYLFNIGVDDLEEEAQYATGNATDTREHLNRTDDYPAFSTPSRVRPATDGLELSPIADQSLGFAFLPRIANIPPWIKAATEKRWKDEPCLLYTSPSPRDRQKSRMPSSA